MHFVQTLVGMYGLTTYASIAGVQIERSKSKEFPTKEAWKICSKGLIMKTSGSGMLIRNLDREHMRHLQYSAGIIVTFGVE